MLNHIHMFKKHQIKLRQAAPFSFPLYRIDKRNQADPSQVQVMSNVWLPPKFIIYPSKLPPAVACVKMTRYQFEGWKWGRGGGQIILLLPGNGIFIDFINHSRSQEKSKYAFEPAEETSNGSMWHVWHAAFIKLTEMIILLTHYLCASVAGDGWWWCWAQPWHSSQYATLYSHGNLHANVQIL